MSQETEESESSWSFGYSSRQERYYLHIYQQHNNLGGEVGFFSSKEVEEFLQDFVSFFEKIEGKPFNFQGIQSYEYRQEEKKRKRDD